MKHMTRDISSVLDCRYCAHSVSKNKMQYCTAETCEAKEYGYNAFELYPPKDLDGPYKRFSGIDGDIGDRQMEYGRRIRKLLKVTN